MKKKYKITYDYWDCVIEFDTNLFTKKILDQCLNFFEWEYNEEGDLYAEYAKKLAGEVIKHSMLYNVKGVIRNFDEEGMPKLDGSDGVTLISCDYWEFADDEFEIEQI